MKKVINGRSYNTETAKELGYQTNGYANNDFYFTGETLYRKKTGEFFLYGEGGAYSIYGRDFGMSRGSGKKIIPLSEDEAKIINRTNELLEKISNSKSQMSQYKAELIALSQQIESNKAKIKVQESELQKNLEDSDYIINNISISNYNYSNKNGNISTGIIIDIYI